MEESSTAAATMVGNPRVEELRQKIAIATEQIAKGQVTDGEVVFDRL